ncbi:MAG: hypothetical protein JYX80_03610 [Candidatus Scalindua sediminis]|nr:hypothetical protein [Candidatus Scalindua sediminis]HDY69253.1 hypothetical protein [Candidatus Scalindua sp.]
MNLKDFKSTSGFISELSSLLKKRSDADLKLIDILENNILKSNTASNASSQALQKIKDLAEERAKS